MTTVIDQKDTAVSVPTMYVSGEWLPSESKPSQRPSVAGSRVLKLSGAGDLRDLESRAFDAACALREWYAHARQMREMGQGAEVGLVKGFVRRVVDESVEVDGVTAWVMLDGDKPSRRTVQEYRGSVRDVLIWLAGRGICPAEAGAEDMKAFKAWLQADGAPEQMELLRARWYGREPRIVYERDWRGSAAMALMRALRAHRLDAVKADAVARDAAVVFESVKASNKRSKRLKTLADRARTLRRLADEAAEMCGWLTASLLAVMSTYMTDPRVMRFERYTSDTVSLRITLVRNFWKMAMSRQAVFENPLIEIRVGKGGTARAQKIISRFYGDDEVLKVLALCDENKARGPREKTAAARNTAMIRLMRNQGLRVSEVAGLDLSDFNPGGEAGSLHLRHAKGDKSRTVLLTERTRQSLDRWLAYRALLGTSSEAMFVTMNHGARPDAAQPGERMDVRAVRAMFDDLQKRAGIKRTGRSVHGLRHAYATRAMMEDPSQLIPLSLSMGHSSPTITMGYVEASELIGKNPAKLADI